MSHIVTCSIEVRNISALEEAAKRLGFAVVGEGEHRLYGGQTVRGVAVQLPDWNYLMVADVETGELKYDNFNGNWGDQKYLDQLMQEYSAICLEEQAYQQGYSVERHVNENGDIRLTATSYA
jgi:hypothetical protein